MMLRMRESGDLLDRTKDPPELVEIVGFDIPLEEISRSQDGNWVHVKAIFPKPAEPLEGDVLAADVVSDKAERKPFDIWAFVKWCTLAARLINQGEADAAYGVNRDYLIALALVLNDIQTLPFSAAQLQAFDPFHFTEEAWAGFLKQGSNSQRFVASDRLDQFEQIDAMCSLVFDATRKISEALSVQDAPDGPYIPNSIDLFLVHVLGSNAAIDVLRKVNEDPELEFTDNPDLKLTLSQVVPDATRLAALKQRYPSFLDVAGVDSIASVLTLIETKFDAALKLASLLLQQFTPEDLPVVPEDEAAQGEEPQGGAAQSGAAQGGGAQGGGAQGGATQSGTAQGGGAQGGAAQGGTAHGGGAQGGAAQGRAPWFGIAQAEKGVAVPNKRILDYFQAIGFHGGTTSTAWCGAFVGFCLKSCPDTKISGSLPAGPARAANWKTFGVGLPTHADKIPKGAIVVLSPLARGTSGHVSFFLEGDDKFVTLFGGNQGHKVQASKFKRVKVVAVRWPKALATMLEDGAISDGAGGGSASGGLVSGTVGPLDANDWNKYCDVLGNRESTNNYRLVNKLGYCGRWQFGAMALIDLGLVKPGRKNRDLMRGDSWTAKHGITSRDAWLGNKQVQNDVMLEYTRMHYRSLVKLGALTAGSSKARTAGLLAAAHLMGVGGAMQLVHGTSTSDAFGTSTARYFALLSNAFGGPETLTA